MIEILRDDKENIIAVCEWWLVDKYGNFDKTGEYVWIQELEVNPEYRHKGLYKFFIKIITDKVPWSKYGYFSRRKYNSRVRMYSRSKWLKLI